MDKQHRIKVSVEDIARVLHSFRKKKGMTQKAIAEELGISQSNFSKMENALLQPSAIQWMIFSQLVDVNPSVLIENGRRSFFRSKENAAVPVP